MKKLGFCINSLEIGGAEKLLVDIIKLLNSTKKYEIFLLTKNESKSFLYDEIKDIVNYNYLISNSTAKKYKKYGKFGNFLISLIKRRKFVSFFSEVEVIIDFLDCDFYKYLKLAKNKKKISWLHLDYNDLLIKKRKISKKLKYYDEIITITDSMYKEVKSKIDSKKIKKVYNFIDYSKIDKLIVEKKEQNYYLKKEYFLTVCRLDEDQKDVTTLLKAFSQYKGDEILYIIGEGKSRTQLENLMCELNLKDRVKFLGIKKNPYIYMKAAKAFILSSKAEGFGLVIAEALYCGTNVIASDCNYGPREILLDGMIGELFEVGNIEELLDKMNTITKKMYSRKNIENSLKRFSKQNILHKLEMILDD